jgi:hypothetical protein
MSIKLPSIAAAGLLISLAPTQAADLEVTVEIPRLSVAEYHRPYAAIWLEKADQTFVANLAAWYQLTDTAKGEKGATWLKDLRAWWRKSGRELNLPVDGVSGATKPPGTHRLAVAGSKSSVASLPPGSYQLAVEVARETGGREIVRVPFQWPQAAAASANGAHEIGKVQVIVKK